MIPSLETEDGNGAGTGPVRGPAPRKRGADLLGRLVAEGARGVRVRRLGGDRAGEIRFTRFLRNPAVTPEEMIATGFARTQAACAGRDVLAVQDTTVTRSDPEGGTGSFLHATIAVDAGSGAVLGALDAQFLDRAGGARASRLQRSFEDRQSARWLLAAERAGKLRGAARITVVADREADVFELFARRPAHVDLLVRAMHDRALADGGSRRTGRARMAARIAAGPSLGHTALDLPARPGVAARTARLAIRFGRLDLAPPPESRRAGAAPLAMSYVDLREEDPPAGVTPVHWRLLSSRPVETVAEALDAAARYALRWRIEEVFRVMKRKGFDIEALRIADAAPRGRLVLACLIAATVVLQMTGARDGVAGAGGPVLRPLTDAFDPDDRPLLEAVSRSLEGRTARQKNPHPPGSLAFAAWVCARLGGWTGYYGKPGPIVILSGWTEFQSIKRGAHLRLSIGDHEDV